MKRKVNFVISLLVLFSLMISTGSCEKDDSVNTEPSTSIKDVEGNTYLTVKIGNQTWMAENLRTTKYNDGTPINKIENSDDWDTDKNGAYCWYDNDEIAFKNKYGALYNWYAVNTGKIAPEGWHVPTDEEFKELEKFLGMSTENIEELGMRGIDEGDKLKSTDGWHLDGNGTDDYGFAALPSGYRNASNSFVRESQYGYIWSSSEISETNAWYRGFYYHVSKIGRFNTVDKKYGFAIRCVKDAE